MSKLILVPCPLCGARGDFLPLRITRTDLHIQKYGDLYEGVALSEWKACPRCGFVHQNPRPSLEALSEFYAQGRYHPPEVPENVSAYLDFANWYYAEKVDFALSMGSLPAGRVFEIGTGLGGSLHLFRDRGWATFGVEPDATQAAFATNVLDLKGVRQGLLDDSFRLDSKVDLIFSNHAFEHLADLDAVMRAVTRILRPGGYIFTAVPTYFSNRSRLSKQWMNSSHYSLFTHRSLNQLFARYGIEEVCHTYRGWRKEVDDLWHVGRLQDGSLEPTTFFENSREVQKYVDVYNPLRSILYAPMYAEYAWRVSLMMKYVGLSKHYRRRFRHYLQVFNRSPSEFFEKARKRCIRAMQAPRK